MWRALDSIARLILLVEPLGSIDRTTQWRKARPVPVGRHDLDVAGRCLPGRAAQRRAAQKQAEGTALQLQRRLCEQAATMAMNVLVRRGAYGSGAQRRVHPRVGSRAGSSVK